MGMSGISSSHSSSSRSSTTTLSEINVTPLVDVMLVLLIIFMISAPLMQQGIQVDLPKTNAGALAETPEQLVLSIEKNETVMIAEKRIDKKTLFVKLQAIVAAKPQIEVVIRADRSVSYGFVAQVMAEVKRAGISRIGLATESPHSEQTQSLENL